MKNKFNKLISDTFIFAVGNASSKIVLFFLMPIYTAYLSTSEYGISDTLNTLVELTVPILSLCISESVFRFCIDKEYDNREVFTYGLKIILLGICVGSVIAVIILITTTYEYTILVLVLFITHLLKQYLGYFLRGIGQVKKFALFGILNTSLLAVFSVVFLLVYDMRIFGYLLSIIFSNAITVVIMIINGQFHKYLIKNSIDKKLRNEMIKYSLPMIPNTISWWVNTTSSRYILLFMMGTEVTGMYSAASKLPSIINVLSSIFQQAWMYSATKEYDSEDKELFYSQVFRFYSSFINVACSLVIVLTPLISKFVLLNDFYESWIYVPLLIVSACLGCYSVFFGGFYTASKNNRMLMISTLVGSIINITFCVLLIPKFGVFGALISSNLCYLSIVIIRVIDTRKFVELNVKWRNSIISLILLVGQSTYCLLSTNNILKVSVFIFILIVLINANDIKKMIKDRK